jgi:hypothetical protein
MNSRMGFPPELLCCHYTTGAPYEAFLIVLLNKKILNQQKSMSGLKTVARKGQSGIINQLSNAIFLG